MIDPEWMVVPGHPKTGPLASSQATWVWQLGAENWAFPQWEASVPATKMVAQCGAQFGLRPRNEERRAGMAGGALSLPWPLWFVSGPRCLPPGSVGPWPLIVPASFQVTTLLPVGQVWKGSRSTC